MIPRREGLLDAVIAGGGPAGAATALGLARRGLRVVLAESSRYETFRAGETLPPYASKLLADLGLTGRFLENGPRSSGAICSAWGGAELATQHFLANPHGSGWHIDRRRFDAMLAGAAADAGATVLTGARIVSVVHEDGGLAIAIDGPGGRRTERARLVVDATGGSARIARTLGARRVVHDRLIGLVGVMAPPAVPAIGDALVLEAAPEGWWYSVPLPDGSLLAAYMTDGDRVSRGRLHPAVLWAAALERTFYTRTRARGYGHAVDVQVRRACSSRLDAAAGPGWLAVGDAASACDPLSAEGICRALESGASAAEAIEAHLGGDAGALGVYAAGVGAAFDRYLALRAHFYGMERRWPASPFWQRRHAPDLRAVPIVLDPLAAVVAVAGAPLDAAAGAESLLPPAAIAWLARACREPVAAHELLARFKRASPAPASDRRLVAALQLLLAGGAVTLVEQAPARTAPARGP